MSRLMALIECAVLTVCIMAIGGAAEAANYHHGETLICSDCHISHASASHGDGGDTVAYAEPPNRRLLKASSSSDVCLRCHDGQPGVPDVVGGDVNNPTEPYDGQERAAGSFADGIADNWKGHNLPGQGSGGPAGCSACHEPHGNSSYRNLRALDGSGDELVAFVDPAATALDKYRRANVGYGGNIGEKLCGGCHGFGTLSNTRSSGGQHFNRHPSTGSEAVISMDSGKPSIDPTHWISGEGSGFTAGEHLVPRVPFAVSSATSYSDAKTVSSANEVSCLSCHKAHGSAHAFGMIWPYGSGDGAAGSSGCNQCHNITGE